MSTRTSSSPEYEEVEVSLKVRFNTGYDENYYQKILQQDLTRLFSPWAFERTTDLQFGTTLHQSVGDQLHRETTVRRLHRRPENQAQGRNKNKHSAIEPRKPFWCRPKEHQIGVLSKDQC